jgi:hypothetical protein
MYTQHPIEFIPVIDNKWETLLLFDFDFVMYLIYDLPKTFRRNDIDHIHPKSVLAQKGVDWNDINNIVNFQLLDYQNNRGTKSDNEFGIWLENNVTNIPAYLKFHIIPNEKDLWKTDNYKAFLEARKDLIIEKIRKVI